MAYWLFTPIDPKWGEYEDVKRTDLTSLRPRFARRRYLTFVATALSNVRRDDGFSDFPIFIFSDFRIFGFSDLGGIGFWDLGIFLVLGATGHGCSAEGTDAALRALGTGALQASQTYVRPPVAVRPYRRRRKQRGGSGGGGSPPRDSRGAPDPPGPSVFFCLRRYDGHETIKQENGHSQHVCHGCPYRRRWKKGWVLVDESLPQSIFLVIYLLSLFAISSSLLHHDLCVHTHVRTY